MPLDLVIRSQDRINGTPDEYEVLVPPGADLTPYSKYHVSSVTMKGSRYAIPANTTITCRLYQLVSTGYTYYSPITIPKGTPSYNELALSIQNAIIQTHSSDFPNLPALEISVTFDDTTSKFSLEVASGYYAGQSYLFQPDVLASPFLQKLGFTQTEVDNVTATAPNGSLAVTYAATNVHSYEPFPLLYLCSDLVTNSHVVNTEPDRVLAQAMAVVNEPSYGLVGIWEPSRLEEDAQDFNVGRHIYKIKIYWRDINSDPVDFNGVDHTIALRFF